MVRFTEMGNDPENALNSAHFEAFHREITFYRENRASVVWARKWEEYNCAAHLSTPGERLEVNSCAFICDRQCGHECEQIFLIAMELLPEPSSHQHRDGTGGILANQPSCRIPLAQDLCQVAIQTLSVQYKKGLQALGSSSCVGTLLFINASHQFRHNWMLGCAHTCSLGLEGKSFMSQCGKQLETILEVRSECTSGYV
ncbi:hypothetical protein Q9966_010618 [Columba livia]|nr:hypothetical protein Q9966_010618 [Columba livia]